MKIVNSPPYITRFLYFKFHNQVQKTEQESKINIKDLFERYYVDFHFTANKQKSSEIFLFSKISINDINTPLYGYIILLNQLLFLDLIKNQLN